MTDGVSLNGIICASAPDMERNSSPARFCVLPIVMVPILALLGLDLAKARKSPTEAIFASGLASNTMPKNPTVDIGVKLFKVS